MVNYIMCSEMFVVRAMDHTYMYCSVKVSHAMVPEVSWHNGEVFVIVATNRLQVRAPSHQGTGGALMIGPLVS